jgi:hypothetical protein
VQRSELFHVGIVVSDLPAAREHLGELLGLVWGPVVSVPSLAVRLGAGGDREFPNSCCYSTEPPYLELIQEVKGSPWECNGHSNLHHIGFFTDDLEAGSDELLSRGCPLQVAGRTDGQSPASFVYHQDRLGVRIELVDAQLRPAMIEWMCSPANPESPIR